MQRFKAGADAVLALTSGQVDCVVIDNEPAKAFVAKNPGLKLLNSAFSLSNHACNFSSPSCTALGSFHALIRANRAARASLFAMDASAAIIPRG